MKSPLENGEKIYSPSPLKRRKRRTKEQVSELLDAVTEIVDAEDGPITIRHLFYRVESQGLIPKTEAAYKSLTKHLGNWRRAGLIPWDAFADNTRWKYGGHAFNTLHDALEDTVRTYRKNLWSDQSCYLEVWVEKDAIASIVVGEADSFGVPTFVCRGFASLSSLHSAAQTFRRMEDLEKHVVVAYIGDHDPSGICIDRKARETLAEDFGVGVEFERIAVTPEQIERYDLPTRPAKEGDTRARDWQGGCVEVDAMPPAVLRQLVRDAITEQIEPWEWEQLQKAEAVEKETLLQLVNSLRPAA
jgi:hypothetical protein